MKEAVLRALTSVPSAPGVYLMKDDRGRVIYVGKAGNLKKRLSSYFVKTSHPDMKTAVLVEKVASFETIITSSGQEALILESNLIKHHRPRYNVILKDDKRYPALKLDISHPYPGLQVVRRIKNDGALYFGPYASAGALRQTLKMINRTFKLRKCRTLRLKKRPRPCLNYQMRLCLAPCCLPVDQKEYRDIVEEVRMFLAGRTRELVSKTRREMKAAADEQAFECAARLRDKLFALEKVLEKQVAVTADFIDRDIIGIAGNEKTTVAVILFVRQGFLQGMRHYVFKDVMAGEAEVIGALMNQFYEGFRYIPEEIVIPAIPEEKAALETRLSGLRGTRVRILRPRRGDRVRLLSMAVENARALLSRLEQEAEEMHDLLERLRRRLRLKAYPRRIECFDNSGFSGKSLVSGQAVFIEGKPEKSMYRRYAIRSVTAQDDYACMREVMERRFRKSKDNEDLPDLLIVDGGRGQVNIARSVLDRLGLEGRFDLVGIAKRNEKKGEQQDKLYKPGRVNPVNLSRDKAVLMLLQRIRDESHRYAVSYHRKKRKNTALASRLDAVPGIGPKRKAILLRRFPSLRSMREAPLEVLAALPGMNRKAARAVREALARI